MFKTTEITAYELESDKIMNQRFFSGYEQAAKHVKGKMLEIGCGVGKGLELFPDKIDHYTAVDKNTKLINFLQKRFPDYNFIDKFIPPLEGLEDNTFDTVVTLQVIEHIEDDNLFLREIHRVLKTGGKAVIATPNLNMSLTRNPWHVREYTPKTMVEIMEKHFSKVKIYGLHGNEKIMAYYEENKKSVANITRFDILNLQYRLPRQFLQVPYDILNRVNRNYLHKKNKGMMEEIKLTDFYVNDDLENCFDFICVVEK
jgi:ubiquinone/menaquinone biosynthesis C-methylase UbiE